MGEEEEGGGGKETKKSSENGKGSTEENQQEEEHVLKFLDSMDSYLVLMESLSSTLRQGWLELASARHSMGTSRVNGALFDLKYHSAATSLEINHDDAGSMTEQPHFMLCKWESPTNQKCCPGESKFEEDDLLWRKSNNQQLRHRGSSQYSEIQETRPESDGSPPTVDTQVQKERSKSLSMFGTLVSPKLRAAQLSFETALETLVEVANMRSSILCAYDQVQKELDST
ncbi:unnamed protein product [Ilex paraguariensis]|uniref:Vacuolar ATPase assembly protein VMA22 n=1 Tax=Ilex paraguariensis TaxID=185542 RepID=A0ABC8UH21_9AQUA